MGKSKNNLDLQFTEIIGQPMQTIEKVYAHFGWDLTPEVRLKMETWMANDMLGKKGKMGKHLYEPEWYGLDPEAIQKHASIVEYNKRFKTGGKYKHSSEA